MAEPKIMTTTTSATEKSYILDAHRPSDQQVIDGLGENDDTENIFEERKGATTGLGFASFNYINSIVGSGVIGIAFALHQAGFVMGLFLLALVALVTDYSLVLMVRSAHISGSFSYQGLMEAAFGRPGFYLLTFLQFVYPFIAMVSYNVVVGDTVTKVLIRVFSLPPRSIFARRDYVVAMATIFVTIPLCLLKDMAKLAKASFLSLVFIIFILGAIFSRFISLAPYIPSTRDSWQVYNWGIIPAIGIMAFAFMCHHNVFLLYGSIEEPDQAKWDKVTHYSVFVSFMIASLFGIAGYATFTGYSQGDLLENYCWDDDLMNVARIAFSLTILFTFPIECLVTRAVITQAWRPVSHFFSTIAIVATTYLISISTDCLGVVLELNGVISAVPLAFILPAVSYLKLEEGSILSKRKLPALALALFGLLVAVLGFATIITTFSTVDRCSHGHYMSYCYQNRTN
ncbi:putative sodium-coupled neutral amino acid transporter 11 isoform X1 [Cimex lectularius]|uniref:Putative sodium-coupled neutral amino acid transporter 11 n=2 Tax=Cimex lectularius TaxID=79782 RepID=A0A8I6STU4_CIMLE|nr:putative sodium-coupled neutral amino acid transporter 11 isoform X1 [Cimex lectularius]